MDTLGGTMISVSLVDDESALRRSIVTFINGSPGFRCLSAYGSGEEALRALPAEPPDVVLMDINLEGKGSAEGAMSGIECVRRLKAMIPAIQIVMLTVYEDTDQIFKALAAGASGYLLKRLSPAELLEAISDVRAGGSPMSSSIARKVVASFQPPARHAGNQILLSPREQMVLESLSRGLPYKQIADQLGIGVTTVRTYLRRIYEKLHVQSRSEAVAKYLHP